MTYIDVNGHRTWLTVGGSHEQTVLLLHGGLSESDSMLETVGGPIGERYRVAAFDRRGHGRTADTPEPFHYDDMADQTVAVLEHLGGSAHVVGYSDGGIIGLLVALRRPDLLDRLVLIGTNFHHDGLRQLDPPDGGGDGGGGDADDAFARIAQTYAEHSPDGADHFEEFIAKTFTMFASEPTMTVADLARVEVPRLVLVGDDDLVELPHTVELYESIPDAQLAVVPAASHLLPIEQPEETARIILRYLAAPLPPKTMLPSRRS
jgi:pimeloyl-ACP methyl ester carboxylesterase